MMNIRDYIILILDKKKMTRAEFTRKINEIEEKLGEKKTNLQNITNYLNNPDESHNIGYKMALKMEKALGLPDDTLLKMVKNPVSENGKKDFDIMKKKVRNL